MTVENIPVTDVTRSHRSMTQYLITACVHSANNWRCLHNLSGVKIQGKSFVASRATYIKILMALLKI